MKTRLLPLVFVPLVALAGCSTEAPQARQFSDMADWNDEVDNRTNLTCKQRRVVDPGPEEKYRSECIDDKGRKALLAMYSSGADKTNAIDDLKDNPLAQTMLPAILVGPNWTVKCVDEDGQAMCEQWQREIGGDIRNPPDFS